MGSQGRIVHIVGDIISQLDSTPLFAREMLGKLLAAVDEPKLVLIALHPSIPEVIRNLSRLDVSAQQQQRVFC